MNTLLADARHGARALWRSPRFTAIAVLTLALGIGANTAIFSVLRTVLLRPLPFPEADRIVELWESRLDRGWEDLAFTHANFWDVHDQNTTFEAMGALRNTTFTLTGFEHPEQVSGARVSAGFFRALGVTAVAGRTFVPDEDAPSADTRIAVLSHDLWMRRFGGADSTVGTTLALDGVSHTVIGVLPSGRPWLDEADVFVPLQRQSEEDRGSFELEVIGRLKPEVTPEAAHADLDGIARRLAELFPEPDRGMAITIGPSSGWIAGDTLRRALWTLMGGVGLLLLIACVNLANLLLARATSRSRERALRTALGASRHRIVGSMLAETSWLGLAGAVLGLALASGLTRLLRAFDPGDIPRLQDVAIDGWVLAFTTGVALGTSLMTGLTVALHSPYKDVATALREGDRTMMGNRRQGRLRAFLVGAEVAMSLVLLVGAGLLLRSFARVLSADRGFETENRIFFEVALPDSYDDEAARAIAFRAQLLERIAAIESVRSAAAINVRPLRGVSVGMGFAAAGSPTGGDAVPWASWRLVTRDYFRTLGVPLVAGRDFGEQDELGKPWRVIVSRRVAEELWPGQSAVGRSMRLWEGQDGPEAEVIGVVADMLDWGLESGASFAVYMPYYGASMSPVQFVVHTGAAPETLVPSLRALLRGIDPNLPLSRVETLDAMVGANVAARRFLMLLLLGFAALAMVLALAGIYGVLSYTVERRKSEIGMRIALGASRSSVRRLIVAEGMRPVAVGLALGIAGALALSRLMANLLFGVTPADAATYVAVAAVLAIAAAASSLLPAHSAVRLDVLSALREE
jgi:putative ABC transport system permease protein